MSDTAVDIVKIAKQFTGNKIISVEQVTDGAINQTYLIHVESGTFVLQKMSAIFTQEIIANYQAVLPYLHAAAIPVPDLVSTKEDQLVVNTDHGWYRALTYLPGKTIHDHVTPTMAMSAGKLIGQFHNALANVSVQLVEPVEHFHDTSYYFRRLQAVSDTCNDLYKREVLSSFRDEVVKLYQNYQDSIPDLPQRIIHADLKISNLLFSDNQEAIGLIDLDTLMNHTIMVELGDALRSWCQSAGEDVSEQVFDSAVYQSALQGYFETADFLTEAERKAIPIGVGLITLELTARFLTDAYEESYFTLSQQYESLFEQNVTRAKNQLAFFKLLTEEKII